MTGEEVQFTVNFATPFDLPADHYFFVPQVADSAGNFFWLSAARPDRAAGTGFHSALRICRNGFGMQRSIPTGCASATDIVGVAPPVFNATFSLTGVTVPEPASLALVGTALAGFGSVAAPPAIPNPAVQRP